MTVERNADRVIQVRDVNIGRNIRKYRERAGYKQTELVRKLQIFPRKESFVYAVFRDGKISLYIPTVPYHFSPLFGHGLTANELPRCWSRFFAASAAGEWGYMGRRNKPTFQTVHPENQELHQPRLRPLCQLPG